MKRCLVGPPVILLEQSRSAVDRAVGPRSHTLRVRAHALWVTESQTNRLHPLVSQTPRAVRSSFGMDDKLQCGPGQFVDVATFETIDQCFGDPERRKTVDH